MASTMPCKSTSGTRQNLTQELTDSALGTRYSALVAGTPATHLMSCHPRSASYPVASLYPLIDEVWERLPGNEAASPWSDKQVSILQHHSALTYDHRGHSSALHSFKDVVLYILGRGPQAQHPSALVPRLASTTGNLHVLCQDSTQKHKQPRQTGDTQKELPLNQPSTPES